MDPQQLLQGRTRETSIRRDARGRWHNGDDPIEHPSVARAFDGWVDRAEDGRYCLSNDINWAYVEIEGPPFFVREARLEPGGRVMLRLSGDLEEPLDPDSLRQDAEGSVYCDVKGGRLAARFDRYALAALVDAAGGDDEQGPYIELGGRRIRPPVVDEPF